MLLPWLTSEVTVPESVQWAAAGLSCGMLAKGLFTSYTAPTCQCCDKAWAGCAGMVSMPQLAKQPITPGEQPAITADSSSMVGPT